ncbi:MAG TPA: hypothetical protein VGU46_02855 [Acidobacteriaceae bacterium]|nr:hypothetical protein [Acidobacteriaceae bacterium]
MISRVTIFALLLALMLGIGIESWSSGHRDACTPYLAGDKAAQSRMYVASGSRMIAVPCNDWTMRQPLQIQLLCLVDLALAVVFALSAAADLRDWLAARRRISGVR